jgi:hypothetical protein
MPYIIPRPVYEKLVETLHDRSTADRFASSIEDAVDGMEREVRRETVEKTIMIKAEIKDDLSKTLVTRELFDERFAAMQDHIDQRFLFVDERFKRVDLWLKLIVGLSILGLTLANPGFLELVKALRE